MKKPIQKARDFETIELRRWCIECAIRWPTFTMQERGGVYGGGGGGAFGGPITSCHDHNVIDRAEKIMAWVVK